MSEGVGQKLLSRPEDCDYLVGLVLTGGTIAGHENNSVISVPTVPTEVDLLKQAWHGPQELRLKVESPLRLLSENLKPSDWISVAKVVRDLVETDNVAGVVVFHGTDTMAYTAAALSFLLADLDKPVVLTGSNLPPGQAGSDASRNVHDTLVALKNLGPGTYIVFAGGNDLDGLVHLGTRARKLQASGHAFASINREPVGTIIGEEFTPLDLPSWHTGAAFKCKIDQHVLALRLYPGLDFSAICSALTRGHIRGVVIEMYASATGPDTENRYSLPRFIEQCAKKNVTVATTVATAPDAPSNVYETTVAIDAAGGLFLRDMLPETATVKLMWALAQTHDVNAIRELMLRPIAGEIT